MAPALQLKGITKRFGALVANDGISLSLARGQVLSEGNYATVSQDPRVMEAYMGVSADEATELEGVHHG